LADALLESGVLRGDPLDGFFGPFGLQVTDLAEEFTDAGALSEDLRIGGFEGVFGVERPLAPRGLVLVVQIGQHEAAPFVGIRDGCSDRAARLGVFVEERARNPSAATDSGDTDQDLFLA
jgi:hypothetical protein